MEYREDQDIRINNIQARGFITKGNLILLMFRRKNGEEYYTFPGGHMRKDEKPAQTAEREIEEETTIKVKKLRYAYEIVNDTNKKVEKEYYFTGIWESGEPTLSGEESRRASEDNYYKPLWVEIKQIDKLMLYPDHAKQWVINHLGH